MPSRGSGLAQAVAKTTFSPLRTTAEPCACFAQLPVSKEIFFPPARDRKSTRLNSSHVSISYAVPQLYTFSLHDALPISGDSTAGVGIFAVINRERKKIYAFARLRIGAGCRQDYVFTAAYHGGTMCLFCPASRLKGDFLSAG